jgi:hypothetical protein
MGLLEIVKFVVMNINKKLRNIWRIVLLSIAGPCLIWFQFVLLDNPNIVSEPLGYGIEIIIAVSLIIVLVWMFVKYKRNKTGVKKMNYFPLLVCAIMALEYTITPFFYSLQDRSPTILFGKYEPGDFRDSYYIDFRADGTYKFHKAEFMGNHYCRGKYTMKGNIIECGKNVIDTMVLNNRFLIKVDTIIKTAYNVTGDSNYTTYQKNIYTIDDKGGVMYNSVIFEIADPKADKR